MAASSKETPKETIVPAQETIEVVAQETVEASAETVVPAEETIEVSAETTTTETANEATCEVLEQRMKRIDSAHSCFKKYAMGAVAVGFIPVPLADIAALSALQLKMVHSLSAIYDVPFSKNRAKSLVGAILGGSIAINVAESVASLIKIVPFIGQASGVLGRAVTGAASTYAVGKVFAEHFESGGTFLDFDAEKVRAHFKELYEEGKTFVASQKATTA